MTVIKRLNQFDTLDQILICQIYHKVKNTPKDGQERVFKGMLKVRDRKFLVECDFILKDLFIAVGELKINKPANNLILIQ